MDLKVSNGPGLGDERTTSLLLLGFLQSCPNSCFQRELEVLGHEFSGHLFYDDELQTDGNRSSYFSVAAETDSERQEEAVREVARQLAQIGDRLEGSIHPGMVASLVSRFSVRSLSEEDRRQCLMDALEQLMRTCPADVDHEKTQLLLTMLLAKKIADHSPALLRDVFRTTVTFINQNLLASVRNLVRSLLLSRSRRWTEWTTQQKRDCEDARWCQRCGCCLHGHGVSATDPGSEKTARDDHRVSPHHQKPGAV
uniref:Uncharacterized protein n=1 Tax=Ovis aries TaxID=9940 RepID=A0AC11CVC5_SHEEP